MALYALKLQPTVVLSGINAGANLGVNLMVSGTFAAAREACVLGVPAMAVSHYRRPDVEGSWEHCPQWLRQTLDDFFSVASDWQQTANHQTAGQDTRPPLWNVNLPAIVPAPDVVPPSVECAVDRCPIDRNASIDERGELQFDLDFHARAREPGRDVERCFAGNMTLSKLDAHFHNA